MFENCVFKISVDTREWMKKTAVRTIKTMAQSAIGVIGGCAMVSEVNWAVVGSSAVLAGVVCVLTSLAGLPEVPSKTK
ncbi:MAG TPA: holin [Candidatus Blautia pullicola]|jgi:uncharacterized membrane protein|uniref:Holin n=1 Tax=Candidatus Blautia pullicola TaxID=2838498 RepID=A0A9D2JSH6_9FIRM|nr:holin [Candidatus Blautia pullicola]